MPKQMPGIIHFLGYVPFARNASFGAQLSLRRLCAGMTQHELASSACCSPSTILRWEKGEQPSDSLADRVMRLLDLKLERCGIAKFFSSASGEVVN